MKHASSLMDTAAALPGAVADIKWEDRLVYSVGGKMFAIFSPVASLASPRPDAFCCKVDAARFLELTDLPGVVPAPYLARAHWVKVTEPDGLPPEWLEELVREAHRLVAAGLSKKARQALGLA